MRIALYKLLLTNYTQDMNNFSTTQISNFSAMAGVLVLILRAFKVEVAQEDVLAIMGAVVTVVSIIANYVHRYQKGDLTLGGIRK